MPWRRKFTASAQAFCGVFPNRFYFADETRGLSAGFHLIEGLFRDDQPLCKLVLSDAENQELARLWDELYFVTGVSEKMLRGFVFFERSERDFLKHADFDSIREEDPLLATPETLQRFEEIYLRRSGIDKLSPEELARNPAHLFFQEFQHGLAHRAEEWQAAVPLYLRRLHEFARLAYRRPLTTAESERLTRFFTDASQPEALGIEQAVRATMRDRSPCSFWRTTVRCADPLHDLRETRILHHAHTQRTRRPALLPAGPARKTHR